MKPNRIYSVLAVAFFALSSSEQVAAQAPASVTLVRADRLLKAPAPGTQFRDCSNACPEMVMLAAGQFHHGGSAGGRRARERAGFFSRTLGTAALGQDRIRARNWQI